MRAGFRLVLAAGVAALTTLPIALAANASRQEVGFPHEEHEGLFPLCTGCHEGIPEGDAAAFYPEPASCASCHDDVIEPQVAWSGPVRAPSNLVFQHDRHAALMAGAGDPAVGCEGCHSGAGAPRMQLEALAAPQDCMSCHAHETPDHLVAADCAQCHVPLAETAFPVERIAALALPADHLSGAFAALTHGAASVAEPARCATCHTQERCLTCHVDGGREEIARIPAAPPGMRMPAFAASYPVPASHADPDFEEEHGALAEEVSCATCHTRDDCASCHTGALPTAAAALVPRSSAIALGALLRMRAPASHDDVFFMRSHAVEATSDPASCTTCHTEATCASCHDAPGEARFHPADFVARHPADAYGRSAECASCHDAQLFCRSCHVETGMEARGRLGPGFHDGQPLWLLRHGQPARQALESCASCHAQRDCTQCHSQTGSFRVNPHGAGFDADRAWARSPGTCFACHISAPVPP